MNDMTTPNTTTATVLNELELDNPARRDFIVKAAVAGGGLAP
jgi:hypothetical protein